MSLFRPTYKDKKTGEKKESSTWWFEFVYAGRRYRESADTSRKTLAAQREKNRRLQLEQQMTTGVRPVDPAKRLRAVKEAVEDYLFKYDAPTHRAKSIAWVKERLPHVVRLLGSVAIFEIGEETVILGYMRARREEKAGNRTINMELLCLARAVGSTWNRLWPKVPRLHESSEVGQALSTADEGRLLGAAIKNKSRYIRPFIHIALATGMRSGEIRTLQLKRIDLANRELRVGQSKTQAGEGRGIPMNDDLYAAIAGQIEWLKATFGKPLPDWYLFPFCDRVRPIDPTRPVTTIKSAWESVRKAAGVSCRLHDLRHTAATKMAEGAIPEATMKALLGHMSKVMLERYSHIRDEAKRSAVESLGLAKPIFGVPQVSPKVKVIRDKRAG
jgi:integrase